MGDSGCIIKTGAVQKIPFSKVDFNLCSKEGEDSTLESWRNNQLTFFDEVAETCGVKFGEDMEIIFEIFEVVFPG